MASFNEGDPVRYIRCPACKGASLTISEIVEMANCIGIANGRIVVAQHVANDVSALRVCGDCHRCGHGWTLRGAATLHSVLLEPTS